MTILLRGRKALCLGLLLPLLAVVGLAATAGPATATPDHYDPAPGVTFNNPYGGSAAAHRIVTRLVRTINSVRSGHKIRIATWNYRSPAISRAVIRAHNRGVSVRILMDYGNWNPDVPNALARRTHIALSKGNKHRPQKMTSWLRRCHGSCRGPHGIAHTKFYLFDKAHHTKKIVMYGSANATELAASIQWNDVFTQTGSRSKYHHFLDMFDQMKHDRAVKQGYHHYHYKAMDLDFYPYTGAGTGKDPVLSALNAVRCTGAKNGIRGHTKIRIAQTATYGRRGAAIAQRLAQMHKRGCNIRLVYAMFGRQVLKILRHDAGATPVPMTHLAYDADCNGIYDKYLHMKSMTIQGNYAGNRAAHVTFNGSANWTPVSLASDEIVGTVRQAGTTTKYANWIDYLFTHVPASWVPGHCNGPGSVSDRAMLRGVDPYALIRKDL
ncbi:MAG TPA: phospholipase D-like domain-containing protein [Mycobacterium sp.]|nr:phospholipase D-like domain-containing protein [Mycobacterium sp.]